VLRAVSPRGDRLPAPRLAGRPDLTRLRLKDERQPHIGGSETRIVRTPGLEADEGEVATATAMASKETGRARSVALPFDP
jgi:hypothetical protein